MQRVVQTYTCNLLVPCRYDILNCSKHEISLLKIRQGISILTYVLKVYFPEDLKVKRHKRLI